MTCLQDIPHHIFQYMQDYLQTKSFDYIHYTFGKKNNYYDDKYWRNFMNTSKSLQEVKKITIYLKLNLKYSYHFLHQLSYREEVLNRIQSPARQIGLDLVNYKVIDYDLLAGLDGLHCIDLSWSDITRIDMLQQVRYLFLNSCTRIQQLLIGSNMQILDLSYSNISNDALQQMMMALEQSSSSSSSASSSSSSSASRLLYLDLSFCPLVQEVHLLNKIRTLKLRNCDKVEDVSMLGDVHELDLTGCKNVTDVSALGRVHLLSIARTNVTDITALGNVHTLDLSDLHIQSVAGLSNVKVLKVARCARLANLFGLEEVTEIDISGCSLIADLSMLKKVTSLTLGSTSRYYYGGHEQTLVEDLSVLPQLQFLHFRSDNKNMKGLETLRQLKTLKLDRVDLPHMETTFPLNLKKVIIQDNFSFQPKLLEKIPEIHLSSCGELNGKLKSLKNLQILHLFNCRSSLFLASFPWLRELTIIECSDSIQIEFSSLPKLQVCYLENTTDITSLDLAGPSLRSFTIARGQNLKSLSVKLPVSSVRIIDCYSRIKINVEANVHEFVLITTDHSYKLKQSKKAKIDNLIVDVDIN